MMKPHKFFSLKRFGHLLACDLRMNSKRYLYFVAGAAVGFYLIMFFYMLNYTRNFTIDTQAYTGMFIFSLLVLGAFVGSAFSSFSKKTSTANFLLFPASNFEKLLSQVLIYIVAGIALFLLLFWIDAHLVRLSLSNLEEVRTGKRVIEPFNYKMMFYFSKETIDSTDIISWIMCFSIGCFLFTTRLFFGKFALVKSIITGIVLFALIVCFMVLCSHIFFPAQTRGFEVSAPDYRVHFFNMDNFFLFVYSFCAIICLFFLPLAYFKLKEKQL